LEHAQLALSAVPLAEFGNRTENLDPVLFLSGIAVLSAGLVVMRAARFAQEQAPQGVRRMPRSTTLQSAASPQPEAGIRQAQEREVLLEALAGAASTFYSLAGVLPGEASARAVRKADDLRELVWLNRLPLRGDRSRRSIRSITAITRRH
jgi:hypothetical protein